VAKALKSCLDGGKAPDLALFGRMLADLSDRNREAACQVAHAVSTHRTGIEFDFYTAVDDLQPRAEPGASMMGTVEFSSACFYRYSNIDLRQLEENLDQDRALARRTLEAYLRASVAAIPTGKQNSMAAHNAPDLVFAVVRDAGLWSLANAFAKPVSPGRGGDLVAASTAALEEYWSKLVKAYGEKGLRERAALCLNGAPSTLPRVETLEELVARVLKATEAAA
jgi:CRISPR system Cascade subunit CasC